MTLVQRVWMLGFVGIGTVWAGAVAVTTQTPPRTPPAQTRSFSGRVVSGVLSKGGRAVPASGHPVAEATVHLVPVSAVDVTTPITASAIYASPYPAEAVDEPLEDAIRRLGAQFPMATTDAQGRFVIANVPDGRFFVHVTPQSQDTEHLPGGDQSRRSLSAQELRGQPLTIRLSSRPEPMRVRGSKEDRRWRMRSTTARSLERASSTSSESDASASARLPAARW